MEPKKQMKIEMVPGAPAPEAPPAAEEKAKRKGLPAEGEPWKASEHDMVVMGRLSRAIEGVPPSAMRRIAPWFTSLLAESMRETPKPESPWGLGAAEAQLSAAGSWDKERRAYVNYPGPQKVG